MSVAVDLEAVFRRERGRLVALLTRRYGLARLADVEDAVQAAMVAALRHWPFDGVPQNPAAWLHRAAQRQLIDQWRRGQWIDPAAADVDMADPGEIAAESFSEELSDAELQLLFALCHPLLALESQLVLALHSFGGLALRELAAGLFSTEAALAQRLRRARQQLTDAGVPLEVPPPEQLPGRRRAVLAALYLMFNEGYQSAAGEQYQREDLCVEALRLARLVADHPGVGDGEADALVALMLLHSARLASRLPPDGQPLLLHEQDRSQWDTGQIGLGLRYLDRARRSEAVTSLHLQAAIAAEHATTMQATDTRWSVILGYYDRLLSLDPSPAALLGHAVALSRVHGAAAGLDVLTRIAETRTRERSPFLHAARADMLGRLGRVGDAVNAYALAIGQARSSAERLLLERRRDALVISPTIRDSAHGSD